MTETVLKLIRQYRTREAFWAAAENVEEDRQQQVLLLQILNPGNNVALLQPNAQRIEELAAKDGNPYMAYAYARLHDVLQSSDDSTHLMEQYYRKAADHGIGDAYACLAYMYRDGDLGEQDMKSYESLMQQALEHHSEKALQQQARDLIYGTHGSLRDPHKAYEMLEGHATHPGWPDPACYQLMGDADLQMGRTGNAIANYQQAAVSGSSSAYFWWALTECCDEENRVVDRTRFSEIMGMGIDVQAADCYMMTSMLYDEKEYQALDDAAQAIIHARLLRELETGWHLGDNICPLMLASYYAEGSHGFELDHAQAWRWYCRGAWMRSAFCLGEMADMVLEKHTAPQDCDEDYGYECAYRALLLGNDNMLDTVIHGYWDGFLAHHATLIKERWLPEYERQLADTMDDHEYPFDDDDYEQEIEED